MSLQLYGKTRKFLAVLKISEILLKYHAFEAFFMFSWAKQCTQIEGTEQNLVQYRIYRFPRFEWIASLCVRTLMFLVLDTNLCYMYYITYIHICSAKYIHIVCIQFCKYQKLRSVLCTHVGGGVFCTMHGFASKMNELGLLSFGNPKSSGAQQNILHHCTVG